jgi:hypothetical protein
MAPFVGGHFGVRPWHLAHRRPPTELRLLAKKHRAILIVLNWTTNAPNAQGGDDWRSAAEFTSSPPRLISSPSVRRLHRSAATKPSFEAH